MKPLPQISDFPIPYARETELALIAEIVSAPENYMMAAGQVLPDFFFNAANQQIWLTICDMANKHESIRLETIIPRVDKQYFISEVMRREVRGTSTSIQGLIDALRETYIKRAAYYSAVEALMKVERGEDASLVQGVFNDFSEKVAKGLTDGKFHNTIQIGNEFAQLLQRGGDRKIHTGMDKLDWYTMGGFSAGELVILAARPSVGKTSLAIQWALEMSRGGEKPLFFSLEMTEGEIFKRMMLCTGLITPTQMAYRGVDWAAYENALNVVGRENLLINDKSSSLDDICAKITMACMEGKCTIAYIDYLGLMRINAGRGLTKAQIIGEATRKLKNTAKDCGIPIVLLCQINRESAKEGRPPQLTDLRDSGDIEQDADKVVMLEDGSEVEGDNKIKMWLRKCRNGRVTRDYPIMLQGNQFYTNFKEI